MDRRGFLKRGGLVVGVGAVVPTVLAACGSNGDPATGGAPTPATVESVGETTAGSVSRTTAAVEPTTTPVTTAASAPVTTEAASQATTTTAAPAAETTTAAVEETTTTAMMEDAPTEFESITLAQVTGWWHSLDINMTTGGPLSTGQHMFEGLLIKLPDRSLIPGLAAEMPQQVDDLTYRVKIRTDRTFTDGTPITAADIVYGYDRLAPERELGSPFTHYITFIESIGVVADDELRINLAQRVPEDVLFQRLSAIKAYPEAVVEAMGSVDYSYSPTPSSGSMMLAAPLDTKMNVFERYDGYEGPQPLAAKNITYIADQSGIELVEAGEVHILDNVSPQEYGAIEDSPNLELGIARETSFLEVIMFNTAKPPFDNQLVRQAVMYSIDVPQLIEIGLQGEGRIARSPLPPQDPRYLEPQMQYNFDPEKSRALLRQAGYDPDNAPIQFLLGVPAWAYVYPQAPLLHHQLKMGGFDLHVLIDSIDVRWYEIAPQWDGPASYDAWIATIGFEAFGYDPDILFRGWWSGWAENASFATPGVPSKLNELLDAALAEPDFDKQNQLYAQATEIIVTEAGSVPILFLPIAHAWNKSIGGYQMPQTLGMTLFGVRPSGK